MWQDLMCILAISCLASVWRIYMMPNQMIVVIPGRRDLEGVQVPLGKRKTEHLSCLAGQGGGMWRTDHLSIWVSKFSLKSRWNQSHPHIGNGGREVPGTGISERDSPSYFTWATWKHGFYSLGFVTFVVSVRVCLCAHGQIRVCPWNTLSYRGVPVHFLMSIKSYFPQLPVAGLHAFIFFPWHQGHVAQLCIYSNKIFYVFVIWMWMWVLYVYVHVDIGHICILVQIYMWWPNLDTGYLPCSLSTLYFEIWFSLNFEIHHLRFPG